MRAAWLTVCSILLIPAAAPAEETFPGQIDLAAGLACHRNLDLECARARLERALAVFGPEKDPDYLQHVRTARWVLALIHTASDDLGRAEQELRTLLVLDPGFELPPGDHPPKIRYIFEQAKAGLAVERKPDPPPAPPLPLPEVERPAPGPDERFRITLGARIVILFGDDAEAASSGPGAGLRFGWLATDLLTIDLSYEYAYHPTADSDAPYQAMSLAMAGRFDLPVGPIGVRLGGGLGVLAAGTRDRYDHWGLVLSGTAALVWPPGGSWGLVVEAQPSLMIVAEGVSFFGPIGLAGEVRW